jgi:hypothetical protein
MTHVTDVFLAAGLLAIFAVAEVIDEPFIKPLGFCAAQKGATTDS